MSDALPPAGARAAFVRPVLIDTPDVTRSRTPPAAPPPAACRVTTGAADADAVVCDRCGESMFRMHAVWRCPGCGYKTDCCGW